MCSTSSWGSDRLSKSNQPPCLLHVKAHHALRGISQLQTTTARELQTFTVTTLRVQKAEKAAGAAGAVAGAERDGAAPAAAPADAGERRERSPVVRGKNGQTFPKKTASGRVRQPSQCHDTPEPLSSPQALRSICQQARLCCQLLLYHFTQDFSGY